jgi:hypothetical protein
MPRRLHTELRHYALDQGLSLNDIILDFITRSWGKEPARRKYAAFVSD